MYMAFVSLLSMYIYTFKLETFAGEIFCELVKIEYFIVEISNREMWAGTYIVLCILCTNISSKQ